MKVKLGALALLVIVHSSAVGFSVEGKPNFSGTWALDKEKSDLGSKGQSAGAGRGGGRGGTFVEVYLVWVAARAAMDRAPVAVAPLAPEWAASRPHW